MTVSVGLQAKVCARCGVEKEEGEFAPTAFLQNAGWCRVCRKAYARAYYLERGEFVRAKAREWYMSNPERGRASAQAWRVANPDRYRELKQAYIKRDLAERRARTAEKRRAQAEWEAANPEIVRERQLAEEVRRRSEAARRGREWRLSHPEGRKAQKMRHRSRKLAAAGAGYTTDAMIAARVAMFGGLCRYCGAPGTEVDHRTPLVRGGSHWPANLVPTCKSCNSRKSSRTEFEFLELLAREGVKPSPHVHAQDPSQLQALAAAGSVP